MSNFDNQGSSNFDPMLSGPGGVGAPPQAWPDEVATSQAPGAQQQIPGTRVVGPAPRQAPAGPNEVAHNPLHPDFYDPFYDPEEWTRLPRRSPFILRAAFVLGLIAVSLYMAYDFAASWVDERVDPPGGPGIEVAVEIPLGATSDDISRILAGNDIVASSLVTSYYWRLNEAPAFQAGEYVFRKNLSVEQAQAVLEGGPLPPVPAGTRITIPEGLRLDEIEGRLLDELADFDTSELSSALRDGTLRSSYLPEGQSSLEGVLFPATYPIFEDESEDERALVQTLLTKFQEVADEQGLRNAIQTVGVTPYEAVIIASLIEEEAKLDEDRAKISRVIYNRLEQGMPLQIDATVIYALGGPPDDGVVLFSDLEIDSPYNTYQIEGLPPTPISAPGAASLGAAMNPTAGEDWLFYVVIDSEGRHAFANTFAEHEANIARAEAAGVRGG